MVETPVSEAKKELLRQLDKVFLVDSRSKQFYVDYAMKLSDEDALDIAADLFIALNDRSDLAASNSLLTSCFKCLRGEVGTGKGPIQEKDYS
ncbi:MAG: hypothetical protein A3B91_02035 [Candidatus Yanofskybacteria bacterium RIFCSPHIGHO2_02_FULL_41_29]|uniref:Uncharacterized protein n=1 Tax=Candidatus Yanofskybacteria bacterium RIFCSPHIGHO2_01_FULL_41_53 TaxID=1802663 RepID=A0A1F8EF95_9BACT|nr:MAG: hypothetical protein A2650_01315 [Candidatus Yanofskybacteria bacterium RIFCSPHIGHO2_01_FULL_41_53]OGN10512.1 MAG: hypothetical protein A3B91_02035 [Candidatus Yanofskybacteria bacterium RIFCSPHIGHO2_02_FULL_41_29]OGN18909.1 MAG: hypothetical protein A3F48_02595 [Candidatus Yanofskybacteria bacterium RIFCSPHIGHO2_12_FULL_41_9]OGN21499.1 MAG: hypothetical protein A2916_01665 [Candidatus Yanofskybacteria bacterium RIFCSPLOWO2_01_FULL_41_67]OGN28473.1 MAG: hypothetical protein A3H54_04385 